MDSLKGFDENTFINSSVNRGVSVAELKGGLAIAKKEYIYSTYYKPGLVVAAAPVLPHTTMVQPACTNMDFESGTFYGWELSFGNIANTQLMTGCCPSVGAAGSVILNTGTILSDPIVPALSLASPLGGSYIARINDDYTGCKVNRISQTFNVTPSNSIFQLAYAAVLQSSGNHSCDIQPNVNITLLDSAYNTLPCPYLSFSAPGAPCPNSDPLWLPYGTSTTGGHYRDWSVQTIDLKRYIGSRVTIQLTVSDCTQSAHYGYAYFDMKCVPLDITSNSTVYNMAARDSIGISSCGSANAVIGAPIDLGPYYWQGPSGSGIIGATTPTISTATPGTYTITMSPPGACPSSGNPTGAIVKQVTLSMSGIPGVSATATQPSCTNASGTGQVSLSGGTGPFSYSWTPAASNSAISTGLIPGNTYTVVVTDQLGCSGTATLAINPFPNAPTYTITPLNGVLTCSNPTLMLTATTGSQTKAVWSGSATRSLTVSAPGTYSVILTNTVATGNCSTTVLVSVGSNTTLPTASYSLSCNSNTINVDAVSIPGVALNWFSPYPYNPFYFPVNNPGTSTAQGVYTLTATDLSSGCQRSYTASTAPDLLVTATATRVCQGQQTTLQASGATTYTWMPGSVSGAVYIATPGSSTTYSVEGSLNGCSTSPSTIIVMVTPVTNLSVTPTATTICPGQQVLLQASGDTTYTWMPGSVSGATCVVSPTTTSTYYVQGTQNGCNTASSVMVTVNPCTGLEELLSGKDVIVCPNPGHGIFTILNEANTGKLDVVVMNALGQILKTERSENPKSLAIDLSLYSKGIYYLNVQMNDRSKLLKIILD